MKLRRVSNRVKRNICLAVIMIGVLNCVGITLNIIMGDGSINNWMLIFATIGFILIAFAYFRVYWKRIKDGITFGNSKRQKVIPADSLGYKR